jgi:hypothetical protein
VVLHDLNKSLVVEVAISHPGWELAVPHQVVAVDLNAIVGCVVDIAIGISKSEVVTLRLSGLPLLGIFGSDPCELLARIVGLFF